ncbi:MAG TPA: hypothetical protein VMS89_05250 [Methanoregulaceae archaeon]|nr:hypothetical protein [Methanoregulaceae archaeon]
MVASQSDGAVSEIIGFILILAIIAIVASLYLTYVVPSQGRDLEITHMALIQNEFLDYTTSVDSLWINEQNVTIINPFILGTNPGISQGSFLNLPLFQPLPSSGTMSVNGPNGGTTVQVDATQYRNGVSPDQGSSDYSIIPVGGGNFPLATSPNHIYAIITTGTTRATNPTVVPSKSIVSLYNSTKNSWNITISAVPKVDYTNSGKNVTTDIIVNSSVQKLIGNQMYPVSRETTIKSDADPNTNYTVDMIDIIDQAYNLDANITYPQVVNTLSQNVGQSGSLISNVNMRVEYGYGPKAPSSTMIVPIHQAGSLEYQSQNNYWIQQNYIYQMGGVFVSQSDGAVTKIPPAIVISRSQADPTVALVQITDFTVNGKSSVSSTGLVHADTASQVSDGRGIPQYTNAGVVTITVNNANNQGLAPAWNIAMDRISLIAQNTGGVPYIPGAAGFDPVNNWILVTYGTSSNNYNTTLQVQGQSGVTLMYTPVSLNVYVEPEASGSQAGH